MRHEGRNEGVRMSGGTINAGAFAVGRGAQAANVVGATSQILEERGQTQLAQRLEELLHELDTHASRLSNADELREATQVVASELVKDRPNKTAVTGVLAGITDGVKSVAALAAAADALTRAVQVFL